MSIFFPRFSEFSPLYHLANELDRATRTPQACPARTFAPRFDVTETEHTYELYGELPGIDQSAVNIEWAEDNTLTVTGSTQRKVAESTPANTSSTASTVGDEPEVIEAEEASGYRAPSVEEESTNEKAPVTETKKEKEVEKPAQTKPRFWVHERTVGKFSRAFKFPIRVDHEGVKASLKNGILSITVPKAKPLEPRTISIQ